MTLVLACANRDQVVLAADRRLTVDGTPVDEEYGKCGSIAFSDAQLLFGFTGIARTATVDMRRWLLDALYECAPPDFKALPTLERLRDRCTAHFQGHPELAQLTDSRRRFALLLTGYLYTRRPPRMGAAVVSNFISLDTGEVSPTAWGQFVASYVSEKDEPEEEPTFIERVGAMRTLNDVNTSDLREMLKTRKPAPAIIQKVTDMLLRAADSSQAGNTVGKQVSWLKLLPDRATPCESGYYSNIASATVFMPSHLFLDGTVSSIVDFGSLSAIGPDASAVVVPKVHRNAPCPCGSGKRYRDCHRR